MPSRLARMLAAALVALAFAAPAAMAQQAPSLGSPSEEETAPQPVTTSTTDDGGLDTWQQALIFGAGVVLLGGIAFAIIGDARQRAPGPGRDAMPETAGGPGHRHRQRSKERARAKAKAAKAQRRRNR